MRLEQEKVKIGKAEAQEEKARVTAEYECGENCRTCPFPGAKCVANPEIWKHIK